MAFFLSYVSRGMNPSWQTGMAASVIAEQLRDHTSILKTQQQDIMENGGRLQIIQVYTQWLTSSSKEARSSIVCQTIPLTVQVHEFMGDISHSHHHSPMSCFIKSLGILSHNRKNKSNILSFLFPSL